MEMDRGFMRQTRKSLFRGRYIDWNIQRQRGYSNQSRRRSRFRGKNDDNDDNDDYDDDNLHQNVAMINLNRYSTFYVNNINKNAEMASKESDASQQNRNADGKGVKEAHER